MTFSLILLVVLQLQLAFAHEKQLLSIKGKPYLFVVGSIGEPVYLNDKSGVELFAYTPDPKDPLSEDSNSSKPITGLEKTLKVEVSAGPVNKTLDFEPDEENPAHYTATFFPSAETTYTYTLTGTVDNTPVHISYSCIPGGGEEDDDDESAGGDNTKTELSQGVIREQMAGGFSCPIPRDEVTIP
ncbi:MAG TPA: hypothetical protein VFM31_09480 [Nitrososphaeraceae archaeon]|nr:hypothetical protein [Nitrososphaeraceae archaeon]